MLGGDTVDKFPVFWALSANVVDEAEDIVRNLRLKNESHIIMEDGYRVRPSYW